MNSVEAKKGFKTFILLASGVSLAFGAYKGIPAGYQYLTQAKQPVVEIEDLQIKDLTPTAITITWKTEKEVTGFIVYGMEPSKLNRKAPSASPLINHKITIENLTPQTTYYYKIGADDTVLGKTPYQFTTP